MRARRAYNETSVRGVQDVLTEGNASLAGKLCAAACARAVSSGLTFHRCSHEAIEIAKRGGGGGGVHEGDTESIARLCCSGLVSHMMRTERPSAWACSLAKMMALVKENVDALLEDSAEFRATLTRRLIIEADEKAKD